MRQPKDIQAENKVRFYVFHDERFVDLNLYQFGWEKCEPMHRFGPAVRNHFLFHYVISGRGTLDYRGLHSIKAGQGFLICPDQITTYYADAEDPWIYTWVEFDGMRARECMTLAGLSEDQPIYTSAVAPAENHLQNYMLTLVDSADKAPIRLIGLGMILLDEIVQTSKTKITTGNKHIRDFYLKEALTYIERNFQRNVSIEEIADASGLNRSYFSRLFKETFGQSPQQFLIQYRLTKAADLLKNTQISVAEVGRSVGYDNQLHFSRAFKSVFGVPPSEYRNLHYFHTEK